ncbi:sugar-binding domain-containing protein [Leeuwenhoekiella sp. MAR_2009_132]|uniref:sugar-binding domain-containing protein n=1 Tax=Leeuwenhoekiella sp. MAR_2009_132 TaxID=1392489 RepID=UPI0009DF5545|nr:sugar-binding domain-containing protein [Leeuwenhoekiella sp. MAR_2009_132]
MFKFFTGIVLIVALNACNTAIKSDITAGDTYRINLTGNWQVKLDSLDAGEAAQWFAKTLKGQAITLPGTLDDAGIGTADTLTPALNNYVLSNLARKHQYIGKAWYQREITIPENWSGKEINLKLERVLWKSTVFIDNKKVASRESLIGSHDYELGAYLTPGTHSLTVLIDNSDFYPNINVTGDRYPIEVNQEMAHAYTNHTQIKWNGILGEIVLTASDKATIANLQVYSDTKNELLDFVFESTQNSITDFSIEIQKADGSVLFSQPITAPKQDGNLVKITIQKPENIEQWDEFNPVTYKAVLKTEKEQIALEFGYRTVTTADAQLHLNNHRIFLRGNLECVIFPLTGYPPMQEAEWASLYKQAKDYGLNHIRFHSWCPPEAAFAAADKAGMYLQVELPHWSLKVGKDAATTTFLQQEADKILKDYGHHPSFLFFSMGNELEGDFNVLNDLVADLKMKDSRHLYATTSYSFQKPAGLRPELEDQFFITQYTEKGWVRGQGIFNTKAPHFDQDYTATSSHLKIPMISHEIGQYSVYPDLSEIPKYTGVLAPHNFVAVKNDLEQKGLIALASDFTRASGKLAAMLYKEEIERALKTPGFDGFQLLQLQDFPGQGTALVGLLNAFWESKGIISGEEFKTFNSELVPLARFEKAVYEQGETVKVDLEIANFYKELKNQKLLATLKDSKGTLIQETRVENLNLALGNNVDLGILETSVQIDKADVWSLELKLDGTNYVNNWSIWVYPKERVTPAQTIVTTQSFEEATTALKSGKTVFFNPKLEELKGIEGRFVPVFWSPVHFPDQPGTMGLLIDTKNKALTDFPTSTYSQWQWWDLCIQSKSVKLDGLQIKPIVRVIDNFVTNHDLANLFEAKVGDGKLVFSAIDLSTDLKNRPVARQLRNSILNYMASEEFQPKNNLAPKVLTAFKK